MFWDEMIMPRKVEQNHQFFVYKHRNKTVAKKLTSLTLLQTRTDQLGQHQRDGLAIEIVGGVAEKQNRKNVQLAGARRTGQGLGFGGHDYADVLWRLSSKKV